MQSKKGSTEKPAIGRGTPSALESLKWICLASGIMGFIGWIGDLIVQAEWGLNLHPFFEEKIGEFPFILILSAGLLFGGCILAGIQKRLELGINPLEKDPRLGLMEKVMGEIHAGIFKTTNKISEELTEARKLNKELYSHVNALTLERDRLHKERDELYNEHDERHKEHDRLDNKLKIMQGKMSEELTEAQRLNEELYNQLDALTLERDRLNKEATRLDRKLKTTQKKLKILEERLEYALSLDLEEVKGIGSRMTERLKELGMEKVPDLLKISPEELSRKLGVSQKIVNKWFEEAMKLSRARKEK